MGSDHQKKHKKDKKKKKKRKHHDSQGEDGEETVISEPKIALPQSNKGKCKVTTYGFLFLLPLKSSISFSTLNRNLNVCLFLNQTMRLCGRRNKKKQDLIN